MPNQDLYFSRTLATLTSLSQGGSLRESYTEPEVACADCPAGVWYKIIDDALECRCSILHRVVWDGKMLGIEYCDGREQELAALAKELAKTDPNRG